MPRIRLLLEYDGTDFVGWQVQPNGRSVQAVLEGALAALLGEPISTLAAGRTDAGVHARGQVVAFDSPRALPLKAYARGLNGLLPPDVAVREAREAAARFDPRRDAAGKRYVYRLSNVGHRSPLRRRTHWELFQPLDVDSMARAAPTLIGRHDFSAFRGAGCEAATPERELWRLELLRGEEVGEWRVVVEGTAFLRHMVRNLVGTLVEVGRGRNPPSWPAEVLAGRDRTRAGPTAPAHGLCLDEVFYPPSAEP